MGKITDRILHSTLLWNIMGMILVVILVAVGIWFWMGYYTHHGESIEVPNVKGMVISDAEYTLTRARLQTVVADSGYDRKLPAGTVLEQLPAAGKQVKSGREIYLTINSGKTPTLALPDIADNSSLREAEAKLRSMGFKLGPIEYAAGDKDWVMAVKCRGRNVSVGERISIDDPLTLVVGNNDIDAEDYSDEDDPWDTDSLGEETEASPLDEII